MSESTELPVVLVVDDEPNNIELLRHLLAPQFRVRVATNGQRALKVVATDPRPDIILLDVMMPEMDGWEACRRLKSDPGSADIPVIFLTAKSEVEDEQRGLALGAVDYIMKPISPPIVLARLKTHLALKNTLALLRRYNLTLEDEVRQRTHEVQVIQEVTIMAMASLAETRDNETGNHIRRTQNYVRSLAAHLSTKPKFAAELTAEAIDLLYRSAPLHDIGKVGIPDSILRKPGPLTAEEFEVMKTHTRIGHDAIAAAERLLETPSSFLRYGREIALSHQEKWDGSGYPEGLAGEAIPLSARLMALADVYDALISERCYKQAMTHEQAVELIKAGRGTHFDPDIVDGFLEIDELFKVIAARFLD